MAASADVTRYTRLALRAIQSRTIPARGIGRCGIGRLQEGEQLFDAATGSEGNVVLGAASVLAEQPEFSGADRLRRLLALTERPQALGDAIRRRGQVPGISITIGAEHDDPRLEEFTVVTAEYHVGSLAGVIGVIGPTRMSYEKVISLVSHTSRLLSDLLD